jgi:hypothetical protein
MATLNRTVPVHNAQKLVDISRRFSKPEDIPDAAPTPAPKNDLIDELNMTRNIFLNTGSDHTIDVQPDYRIIFRALTYHVIRIFPEFDLKPHPTVTPMTIMAYFLFAIYGYALTCDSHARRLKSYYCNEFHKSPNSREILQSLLNMQIPTFLTDFITALSPTADPRRPGFEFVNTLGAFNAQHDIFRLPTPAMFTRAHDIISSTRSNADPHTILNIWYDTIFLQITGTNPVTTLKIANFFGMNYDTKNTSHGHPNWLNECAETLFNPVVSRSLSARPTYRKLPTFFSAKKSWDFNPYEYALMSDDSNIFTTIRFIDEMSSFFRTSKLQSFELGSVFSKTSGISILTHYCTEPALPTWHLQTVRSTGDTAPIIDSDPDYATKLHFLTVPTYTKGLDIPYPVDNTTFAPLLYLVNEQPHDDSNSPDHWITFDAHLHVHPTVRYFDPYDYSPSKLGYAVISGLTIETFEIDGFTVPNVNLRSSLDDDNDQFLQSAVLAGNIQFPTATTTVSVSRRSVTRAYDQKSSISLWNFAKTRLPRYDQDVQDTSIPASIPGFHSTSSIRRFNRSSNHYGTRTHTNPGFPRAVYAWSSYRYLKSQSTSISSGIFFILSFRTFYGTNVTLSESRHPSLLIPN